MQDRFKFRIPMFTDKGTFMEFQYLELGDFIECTLCGTNGEPQQCTGLKDKNGKLIYEGDIIQIPDDYDTYGMFACEKREIYFNEGGFRLKPKWDKISRGNWLEDTKDFEVIGNIYENKELLNGNR